MGAVVRVLRDPVGSGGRGRDFGRVFLPRESGEELAVFADEFAWLVLNAQAD